MSATFLLFYGLIFLIGFIYLINKGMLFLKLKDKRNKGILILIFCFVFLVLISVWIHELSKIRMC